MRAIKRYYTEHNRKAVEFYKRMANKALTHANKAVQMLEEINAENKELKKQNRLYSDCIYYWHGQYREKADELALLKNTVDLFFNEHPELIVKFKMLKNILEQEEED